MTDTGREIAEEALRRRQVSEHLLGDDQRKPQPPRPGTTTIETFSGRYLSLADPDPSLIVIDDIAHHLAACNRYAGACRRPLSVAEHAILVSYRLEGLGASWPVVMWGLHHDDPEAFMHDVTRPLKEIVGPLYRPAEAKMMVAIRNALDLPALTHEEIEAVHEADNWALAKEAHFLMHSRGVGWWCEGLYDPDDPSQNTTDLDIPIWPKSILTFSEVKEEYKIRHRHLDRRIGQ